MRHAILRAIFLSALAGAAGAQTELRDVPQIDNGLFTIGLAHEIHKKCPTIEARIFRGISALSALEHEARDLGFSDKEIRAHVKSKEEKKRLRERAAEYMKSRGLGQSKQDYCALGEAEITQKSEIGALLRAVN